MLGLLINTPPPPPTLNSNINVVNMQFEFNYCWYVYNLLNYRLILSLDRVTGSEAMFADLCYFSVRSVQVMNYAYFITNMASVFISFTPFIFLAATILMNL